MIFVKNLVKLNIKINLFLGYYPQDAIKFVKEQQMIKLEKSQINNIINKMKNKNDII